MNLPNRYSITTRLGNLLSIKPNEWEGVLYFFLVLLFFSFGVSIARSIGMTLLLNANNGGNQLPVMYIITDLSVMIGSLIYAHYTKKVTGLAILGFFLLSTVFFSILAQFLFALSDYKWVYGFFFVGYQFFYILITIHVGTVIASYFNAVQFKRVTMVINAGMPIGGALGGTFTLVFLKIFGITPQYLVIGFGWACLMAFALLQIITSRLSPVRTSTAQLKSNKNPLKELGTAFKYIIGSQLMIFMSLGLMLFVIGNKLLEYQCQNAIYLQIYPGDNARASFLASYEIFANLAWLFVQLAVTSRVIMRLGVGASNLVYPVLSALAAFALFVYFYAKAQGYIANAEGVMLFLGILTQFINQEMRGALRTPASNLLFNAIPPNLWGTNKAFINGIVFPFSTLIVSISMILITGTGANSFLMMKISPAFPTEVIFYLLPLIAVIVSLLGIVIAIPQWSAYDKEMFGLLNRELFDRRNEVTFGGRNNNSLKQVIEQKLTSDDQYHVIAALEMIRVLRLHPFVTQVGNLLLKSPNFEIKKYCINTLAALPQSQTNHTYLVKALQTEKDAQVLPLILKNLANFKMLNFNQQIEELLYHPSPTVFVEACLCLYKHPLYEYKSELEEKILLRLQPADSRDITLYLYALGELRQPHYYHHVLTFLENDRADVRLAAFTAFIRMLEGQLEPHKDRLIKALSSSDKEMKIIALRALKECQSLDDWTPIIQLLGARDRTLVNESKELLRLSLSVCKPALVEQVFSDRIFAQQRFEILSLIYPKVSEEQRQWLRQGADEALKKFIQINGLLKIHESLNKSSKVHDLVTKVLQEIAEEHLLHVLTIITFASEQNMEFYQRVSRGLLSLSRANQGNALEVLSNARERYLVSRVLKYFDERLNDIRAVSRMHVALFGETLRIDESNYEPHLVALNHDMIRACLLYIEREKTGVLELDGTSIKVKELLVEN